uniref:Peroxin-19 n=1 Tax=Bicosoecida sp. CB-2014 TaxID=1486930 RepID=A0A7S1CAN0_9STRA
MARPVKMEELDAVLEKALDDFDEDEGEVVAPPAGAGGAGGGSGGGGAAAGAAAESDVDRAAAAAALDATKAVAAGDAEGDSELAAAMASLMEEMQKPEFNSSVEASMRELSGEAPGAGGAGGGIGGVLNPFAAAAAAGGLGAPPPNAVDKSVAQTLEMMSGMAQTNEGIDPAATEAMGEDVMKSMMEQFERMGEKEDFQSIVDNMMRQMLSKEIMYVPMKQIAERFPEWLADNEKKLSEEEYEKYGMQYQYFQRIVAVYETEPDNFPKLMELMQDMQETGQPPSEIIKELAPGLQFTDDGMPMLPNMGPGMPGMPTIPGLDGAPGPPGACSIM